MAVSSSDMRWTRCVVTVVCSLFKSEVRLPKYIWMGSKRRTTARQGMAEIPTVKKAMIMMAAASKNADHKKWKLTTTSLMRVMSVERIWEIFGNGGERWYLSE